MMSERVNADCLKRITIFLLGFLVLTDSWLTALAERSAPVAVSSLRCEYLVSPLASTRASRV